MAKVLVLGSRPDSFDPAQFRQMCQQLGAELARRGHSIVAGSSDPESPEYWVMDGANQQANLDKRIVDVWPFSPRDPSQVNQAPADSPASIARWPHLRFRETMRPKGDWAAGGAVTLMNSDASILVGGRAFTLQIGYVAIELGRPLVAVGRIGGASQTIWDLRNEANKSAGMATELLDPDRSDREFGRKVVDAMEFLLTRPSESGRIRTADFIVLGASALLCAAFLAFLFFGRMS
jgi:hypothetical protein